MVQLPPAINIPAPKTPKLLPPIKKELLSMIQLVNVDVQFKLTAPAPQESSSVFVQSALFPFMVQFAKVVAELIL